MTLFDELCDAGNLRSAWVQLRKNPQSYGVDEVTIDDFRDNLDQELNDLSNVLKKKKYKPQQLRGHPLEKGKPTSKISDKIEYRILKIPTVRDRVVQKAVEQLIIKSLNAKYKIINNGVSFAYIQDGGVKRAAIQVREYYRKGYSFVYVADIRKFFDEIDNKLLLDMIKAALPDESLMPLIKKFLEIDIANVAQIKERTQLEYEYNPMVGIAQGSPLSPLFANVFLAGLDKAAKKAKLNMVRYADDIVILCKKEADAIAAHDFVEKELAKVNLYVHPLLTRSELPKDGHEKHSKAQKYSGLLFLGLRFTGDKIYPSGTSFNNAIYTVRRAAYNHKLTFTRKLASVDARVRGWCSSYAFTDYLEDKTAKNDKLLEDVLTKLLRKSGLRTTGGKSAMAAVGVEGYKVTLSRLKANANKPRAESKKRSKN